MKVCCWRIGLPFSLMLSPPTVGSSGWRDLYMKSRLPTLDEVSGLSGLSV